MLTSVFLYAPSQRRYSCALGAKSLLSPGTKRVASGAILKIDQQLSSRQPKGRVSQPLNLNPTATSSMVHGMSAVLVPSMLKFSPKAHDIRTLSYPKIYHRDL